MGTLSKLGMAQGDLVDLLTDIKNMINDHNTYLLGNGVMSSSALAIGSTKTSVANGEVLYQYGGKIYRLAANAVGTILPSSGAVTQSKYQAFAVDVGIDGTVDIACAATAAGYTTAALAIAGLTAVATSHVRLGYITVIDSNSTFTPGSDNLDASGVTAAYTNSTTLQNSITYTTAIALTGLTEG